MNPETIESFFRSRKDWLDVRIVETEDGFDVVLRIDGSYLEESDAIVEAAMFGQRLANLGLIEPAEID